MAQLAEVPVLDFYEGGEKCNELCNKVRKACEEKGCFLINYNRIGGNLVGKMIAGMKELFKLPEETKKKFITPLTPRGYSNNVPHISPSHENFTLPDPTKLDSARSFTNLMWPHQGNASFCETLHAMSSEMLELSILIMKMIHQSFGVKYNNEVNTTSMLRMMKYGGPHDKSSGAGNLGLVPHTDRNALTILCQNDAQGFELQSKDGQWERVLVPKNAVLVLVGETLKAWSNGRLRAVMHRVVINVEKERYSIGLFAMPKEDVVVEVPKELVDQNHPLMYKPFKYSDVRQIYGAF